MDFSNFNLDDAEVLDNELNPLSYSPDEYPDVSDLIQGITGRLHADIVQHNPKDLSINGKVVADPMTRYLASKNKSSSAAKEVLKNPASYYFYIHERKTLEPKDESHFDLGTFIHSAFLEPELFEKVVVEPEASRSSTEGCEKLVSFWEKLICSKFKYRASADKRLNKAMKMVDAAGLDVKKLAGMKHYIDCLKIVSGHTAIKSGHKLIIDLVKRNYHRYGGGIIPLLLRGAQVEHSFYGTDESTGLKVKVRPDAFNTVENIGVNAVISLKSTSAQDMSKFVYDSAKYKYEVSEGMYQEVMSNVTGRNFNVTIMIVIQTVAPYLPAVFIWDAEDLANGKYKYRYALDTIKECEESKLYPGFDSLAESGNYGIIKMKQPDWALKSLHPVDLED